MGHGWSNVPGDHRRWRNMVLPQCQRTCANICQPWWFLPTVDVPSPPVLHMTNDSVEEEFRSAVSFCADFVKFCDHQLSCLVGTVASGYLLNDLGVKHALVLGQPILKWVIFRWMPIGIVSRHWDAGRSRCVPICGLRIRPMSRVVSRKS